MSGPPQPSGGFPIGRVLAAVGALAVAGAAVVLIADPFGGGDLSKEEFIEEGNSICADARERFADLQSDPPTSAEEAAELAGELVGIAEEELVMIRELGAPAELQDSLDRYLEAREKGIALLREGEEAARDSNAPAYARAQAELAKGQVKRLSLAQEVGFTECSRPLTGAASGAG